MYDLINLGWLLSRQYWSKNLKTSFVLQPLASFADGHLEYPSKTNFLWPDSSKNGPTKSICNSSAGLFGFGMSRFLFIVGYYWFQVLTCFKADDAIACSPKSSSLPAPPSEFVQHGRHVELVGPIPLNLLEPGVVLYRRGAPS